MHGKIHDQLQMFRSSRICLKKYFVNAAVVLRDKIEFTLFPGCRMETAIVPMELLEKYFEKQMYKTKLRERNVNNNTYNIRKVVILCIDYTGRYHIPLHIPKIQCF